VKSVSFEGQTHVLGAPKNWNENEDGPCDSLAVQSAGGMFISKWKPSFKEIFRLAIGKPLTLWIVSNYHPPVALEVNA
jgi:hypothetical protein